MANDPIFLFARGQNTDVVKLTVIEQGSSTLFKLDAMKFDINPMATLPDRYRTHTDVYRASIDTFVSLHDDHQELCAASGSAFE